MGFVECTICNLIFQFKFVTSLKTGNRTLELKLKIEFYTFFKISNFLLFLVNILIFLRLILLESLKITETYNTRTFPR